MQQRNKQHRAAWPAAQCPLPSLARPDARTAWSASFPARSGYGCAVCYAVTSAVYEVAAKPCRMLQPRFFSRLRALASLSAQGCSSPRGPKGSTRGASTPSRVPRPSTHTRSAPRRRPFGGSSPSPSPLPALLSAPSFPPSSRSFLPTIASYPLLLARSSRRTMARFSASSLVATVALLGARPVLAQTTIQSPALYQCTPASFQYTCACVAVPVERNTAQAS